MKLDQIKELQLVLVGFGAEHGDKYDGCALHEVQFISTPNESMNNDNNSLHLRWNMQLECHLC